MSKLVFFDVDGTLSAPYYPVNGKMDIGMTTEAWIRYCVSYGKDAYQWCKAVPQIKAYAQQKKLEGARLYVLTSTRTSIETVAKRQFVENEYPGLFEDVIGVAEDDLKITVMDQIARDTGVANEECELVEDTYFTLLTARESGFKATHISNILAEVSAC